MLLLFSAGGIVFGNSFDYSGFLPNYIECAGNDPGGVFIAWVNTIAWAGGYVRSPAALRCLGAAALSGTALVPPLCRPLSVSASWLL